MGERMGTDAGREQRPPGKRIGNSAVIGVDRIRRLLQIVGLVCLRLRVALRLPSVVDVFHLPGVERFQFGVLALSTKRYSDAILAAGVDAQRDALAAVGDHLDYTAVDEDAQLQRFVPCDEYRCRFGSP